MASQMVHMKVAKNIADRIGIKEGKAEFILGSVAPDAVHFREPYRVEEKVHSHLFEECGPWGDTQDYDRWIRNIDEFWNEKGAGEPDIKRKMFMLGVCVHCYTDHCNDLLIWRALQKEHIPPMTLEQFKDEYYPESYKVDRWLCQNIDDADEILDLLGSAEPFDFYDYLTAGDMEKIKSHLINVQYNLTEKVDVTGFKYYPSEKMLWFVDTASQTVYERLSDKI